MNLVDKFQSMTLASIERFVAAGQKEDLHLEFKTVKNANLTHADDKRNLARALSGFANSSGGILIWGIEARKNTDGVDCAIAKSEIEPLPLFISRLNELTGDAVSPIVEGVMHRSIPVTKTKGYAITLVPESISGPHMAKLGEDRYYKRSGGSFYRMEHFDLEDMFGRRKKPVLILSARVVRSQDDIAIVLGIRNEGRGSARAPYLAFTVPEPFQVSLFGIDGNRGEGLPRLASSGRDAMRRYGANAAFVIHPGTVHEVARLDLGFGRSKTRLPSGCIVIDYEITAEGLRITRSSTQIDLEDTS
jgi:hypothetical protein